MAASTLESSGRIFIISNYHQKNFYLNKTFPDDLKVEKAVGDLINNV